MSNLTEIKKFISVINEAAHPSEKRHEDIFQEVLDVVLNMGFTLSHSGYADQQKAEGLGFHARLNDNNYIETLENTKELINRFLKIGFRPGTPKSEADDLSFFMIKRPIYVQISASRKGVYVYCERIN